MSFRIFHGGSGWYWRAVARNGKTMADGGEAYARRHDAKRAILRFLNLVNAIPKGGV